MQSSDIRQVVGILQERFQVGEVITDPILYVEEYRSEIQAAGRELEFLQLAYSDNGSPLGWRPTPLLMKFIARRCSARKAKPLYGAAIMYNLLADCVFGYRADRGSSIILSSEILLAVGLLAGDDDEYGPYVTRKLHRLFRDGYFAKREKDGLSEFFLGRYHVYQRRCGPETSISDFVRSLKVRSVQTEQDKLKEV